ncbi:hypothetical protein BXZ70DRAFT_668209 [Cristinia sonorae]|uniref:Uncharacterized protein n=1 Tax=Cristinia sonorae TaxID=1940300 RepID=A0A8K0UVY1_9AGAR|nr:hypothetical protein BXZ70DRAFT_668209 [Cristinia sonorae]
MGFYGKPKSCHPRSDPEGCHAHCRNSASVTACRARCTALFLTREEIEAENLRMEAFRRQWPDYITLDHPEGYLPCMEPFKKKHVCVDCRRTFKVSAVPGNQYHYDYSEDGHLEYRVRAVKARMPEMWDRYEKATGRKVGGWEAFAREHKEEIERVKRPWRLEGWKPLERTRCPGCGEEGCEVGEMFEVPARKDEKGWARVRRSLLERSGGLGFYMTKEREAEMRMEGQRLWKREVDAEAWAVEKQRRIDTLRTTIAQEGSIRRGVLQDAPQT